MYLNEKFSKIDDYLSVAFDAQNGFGSKVLQTNLTALEETYASEICQQLVTLEKYSSVLNEENAESLRSGVMYRMAKLNEEDVAYYSDLALGLFRKHYKDKEDALKALYPDLELTGSLEDDEPFFDDLVVSLDARFKAVHQRAISKELSSGVAR